MSKIKKYYSLVNECSLRISLPSKLNVFVVAPLLLEVRVYDTSCSLDRDQRLMASDIFIERTAKVISSGIVFLAFLCVAFSTC